MSVAVCPSQVTTDSQLIGSHVLVVVYLIGRKVKSSIRQFNRAADIRQSTVSIRVKRVSLSLLVGAYAIVLLYGVLPLVIGLNFELYAGLVGRYGSEKNVTPVLHVWDAWSVIPPQKPGLDLSSRSMGVILDALFVGMMRAVVMRARPRGHTPRLYRLRHVSVFFRRTTKLTFQMLRSPLHYTFRDLNTTVFPVLAYAVIPMLIPTAASLVIAALPVAPQWFSHESDESRQIAGAMSCTSRPTCFTSTDTQSDSSFQSFSGWCLLFSRGGLWVRD